MKNNRKLHTFIALTSLVAVFAPDLAHFAAFLGTLGGGWAKYAVKGVGWLGAFLSAWPVISGKIRPIVDVVEAGATPDTTTNK